MPSSDEWEERTAPEQCPVCGVAVPPRALACPGCGADEHTGWNEDAARYDGLDLPDSAYSDDHAPARRPRRIGPHPLWWMVAAALIAWFTYRALSPF